MRLYELLPVKRNRSSNDLRIRESNPFALLEQNANRMFEKFFSGTMIEPLGTFSNSFVPDVNVSENEKDVTVSAELPGMEEKDIELSLTKDGLAIKGQKKHESENKDKNYYSMERSYGTFERVIGLPCEIDGDKAKAEFSKGVLTVTLPKTEKEKTRKSSIENN